MCVLQCCGRVMGVKLLLMSVRALAYCGVLAAYAISLALDLKPHTTPAQTKLLPTQCTIW
jgi:hypothetical protein